MKFLSLSLSIICLSNLAFSEPPRSIPEELYERFTMGGRIPVLDWYIDDTPEAMAKNYPNGRPNPFCKALIEEYISRAKRKESGYYGNNLDTWLYEALEKYPIQGKEIGIIGSTLPFYECVVIAYGGYPITVEYNKIVSEDPRITTMTVEEFNKNPRKFDVILSISSIEHDGLGRYGDPINPDADLEFMAKAKGLLKEGGHMILAVPVGYDTLFWNANRVYGPLRFPLLIKEWNLVDSFGFSTKDFTSGVPHSYVHQPVLYLEPK